MKTLFFLVLLATSVLSKYFLSAADIYSFPKIENVVLEKEEPKNVPFIIQALANKFSVEESVILKAVDQYFSALDLTRTLLIAQKANQPAEVLLRERREGKSFFKMCEEHKLNRKEIYAESKTILKAIEKEEDVIEKKKNKGPKTAGVEEK